MNRPVAKAEAGFSVVETLIALLLLTVGVAAVTTGFTEGHRYANEAMLQQRATSLAQDKLVEKLTTTVDSISLPTVAYERLEAGVLMGQDEINGITRMWIVESDYLSPGLIRVWVSTQWTRRDSLQTYQLAGLLAKGVSP